MAYYTDVSLTINGTRVATSPRADVGLPNEHKLTVRDVTWVNYNPKTVLRYLQQPCSVRATGPANTPVALNLTIAGIANGDKTVNLD